MLVCYLYLKYITSLYKSNKNFHVYNKNFHKYSKNNYQLNKNKYLILSLKKCGDFS